MRVRRKFPRRGRVRPRWLRPWSLVSAAALTGLWVYGMVDGPGPDPGWIDYVALSAFALPFIMADLWLGGRWYVNLRDDGVTVAHFWGSTAVPWRDIEHVAAEHWGLRIRTVSGEVVTARAFGRPRWRDYGISRLSTAENLAAHLKKLADVGSQQPV